MRKKYLFAILALAIISIPFFAFARGLVPCGGSSETPCTLCYIYVLAQNVMNFLMWQVTPIIAIFAFSWAGFKILISGPNPGLRSEGFGIMKKTLVGMFIVFSSWIIVNETLLFFSGTSTTDKVGGVLSSPWNAVKCVLPPAVLKGPAYDGPNAPTAQAQPRKDLAAAGIYANTNYCKDFDPPNQTTPCTTLAQLPQNAISGLKLLYSGCYSPGSPCVIRITGGTETIGHTTHGPGKPIVDVAMDTYLTSYIYGQVGGALNCRVQTVNGVDYQLCSTSKANYLNEINHWHIVFK